MPVYRQGVKDFRDYPLLIRYHLTYPNQQILVVYSYFIKTPLFLNSGYANFNEDSGLANKQTVMINSRCGIL